MGGMQPAAGSLLIASATLADPNFARCVLLLLDSNEDGSLGVILNRPSQTPVAEVLDAWQDMVSPPAVFFRGGPVEGNAALAVGMLAARAAGAEEPSGWQPLWGVLGMVDLDSSPEDHLGRLTGLRVYAGYAGWGAGQLEAEIVEGSWHVVGTGPEVLQHDLFSDRPDLLWRRILRRQPPPLSMLATLPDDTSLN